MNFPIRDKKIGFADSYIHFIRTRRNEIKLAMHDWPIENQVTGSFNKRVPLTRASIIVENAKRYPRL
jgi:hypothetical protein